MAGYFAKLDAGFYRNPKIRKAGPLGRDVFVFLLCTNADRDSSGIIPASFVEPWYLSDSIQRPESDVVAGLQRAKDAGLIDELEDGSVRLLGWDAEWARRPMTGAERVAKHRKGNVTDNPVTAAPLHVTPNVTSNGCNAEEKIREEEKREEKTGASEVRDPDSIASLVDLAYSELDAGRQEISPGCSACARAPGTERPLVDRLMAHVPKTDRRRALNHALAVLRSRARKAGVIDDLRMGYLGGERSWFALLDGQPDPQKTKKPTRSGLD
jgi:hypothetical protein